MSGKRKVTVETVGAFLSKKQKVVGNTMSDGQSLYLFGVKIAEWRGSGVWITMGGWNTSTTRERLNGFSSVTIHTVKGQVFLNGQPWDGKWTRIKETKPVFDPTVALKDKGLI